ncbi:MAG: glutamate 5-kinase [Candidatus Omnitrophica bacterium]|nr:glutamate 5-kinase [Candidatus Omnitrophota bacterium]MBU1853403.1 glutamate 5-kinase [Candidatus Omnitrophota bacterium]
MDRENIKNAKRIVIKVGTSVLTSKDLMLNKAWIKGFAGQISILMKQGREVIVVSSGAIAAGMYLLGLRKRPRSLPEQQACAALGQGYLIKTYEDFFKKHNFHVAQILLTWEDVRERRRYLNAENTLHTLLSKHAVPVINENDTVAVDEIKFGDNDKLSALVANLAGADLLIMLTDVDGLCVGGTGKCVDTVKQIDSQVEKSASGTDKEGSLGGMKTKLEACKIAMSSGVYCVVANGNRKGVLLKILEGEKIGTIFIPQKNKMQARKRWIAYNAKEQGKVIVDCGAKEALAKKNKSLLACGIKEVVGDFAYGDVITIADSDGVEFAKGLSNYSAADLKKIKGMGTKEAEKIIKQGFYQEVVHRDNLVIL